MNGAAFPSEPPYPPAEQRRPPLLPLPGAAAWGDDLYGLWVDLDLAGVVQRFRWIEPGEFWMGSPDDEPERDEREGPRHGVRLTVGFWLADTACTQALWQAVIGGENPSQFQDDPANPVEQVSWDDVGRFLQGIRLPGVEAALPSEAEWEYACRAGGDTPFNCGATINSAQANYDGNTPYAGGEKGEYRAKTVPVKTFAPNAWGLYEMHGNVWEWCADGTRRYDAEVQHDPYGPGGDWKFHVVRGGSWDSPAGSLRSASRDQGFRDNSYGYRGFRFSLRSTSQNQETGAARLSQGGGVTRDA